MQVSVETTSGVERRMTVTVPAEQVQQEVDKRLQTLARTTRIDGFRPGKVPVKVVATRYGAQVRQEVVNEMTQSTLQQAISQENLRLASMPRIESQNAEQDQDLEYTVSFEVIQDVTLAPMSDIHIEKPVAEISDEDVDTMIDTLRKQRVQWRDVERAARNEDRVTIDFKGTIDGEPFAGGEGSATPLVLGSNSFIPGFEQQLEGASAGDALTVEVTFPDDYRVAELAGKPARFDVKVVAVAEAELPEVDEEFIRSFEVDDATLEGFRKEVRNSMQSELDQAIRARIKQQVMDELVAKHDLDLPQGMVNEEIGSLMAQTREMLAGQGVQVDQINLEPATFEERARRRVALGMLISEIVRQNGLQADPARVRAEVENQAANYDDPEEVIRWYYSDPTRLSSVENVVLEDAVVDWVMGQATVTDKDSSFAELMQGQPRQALA